MAMNRPVPMRSAANYAAVFQPGARRDIAPHITGAGVPAPVPVQTEPTTGWDDSEGTPRKYVRARASNPNGVRVRVKTVNGNIEIRKLAN